MLLRRNDPPVAYVTLPTAALRTAFLRCPAPFAGCWLNRFWTVTGWARRTRGGALAGPPAVSRGGLKRAAGARRSYHRSSTPRAVGRRRSSRSELAEQACVRRRNIFRSPRRRATARSTLPQKSPACSGLDCLTAGNCQPTAWSHTRRPACAAPGWRSVGGQALEDKHGDRPEG